MESAKSFVQARQSVVSDDTKKSWFIIERDKANRIKCAAEVALSAHSGKWLCAVYDKNGPRHDLWKTGMNRREEATQYMYNLAQKGV